jgi:N-hydroxyarylamine O-acetyltransferase
MDHDAARTYLSRIGLPDLEPGKPDADLLRELHLRHLASVPFENLSIHLREPITLTEPALVDKIVGRRRGGFCYELNGAFGFLLTALGFTVTYHAARVFIGDGRYGVPFDHLALVVELEERWLADVGFGRHTSYPLLLDSREVQDDPGGRYELRPAPESDVEVLQDGNPVYRMELRGRDLEEFEIGCWWNTTSPKSHFTRNLTCSIPTEDGRVTLSGRKLITTTGDVRTETVLDSDAAVLAAYLTIFGIELDRVPEVAG